MCMFKWSNSRQNKQIKQTHILKKEQNQNPNQCCKTLTTGVESSVLKKCFEREKNVNCLNF